LHTKTQQELPLEDFGGDSKAQNMICKDIKEILTMTEDIENLGIYQIVENSKKEESLMQEILFEMK